MWWEPGGATPSKAALWTACATQAAYVLALGGTTHENAEVAFRVAALREAARAGDRRAAGTTTVVRAALGSRSALGDLIFKVSGPGHTVQIFDPLRRAARACVAKHPPYGLNGPPEAFGDPQVHVVVVGITPLGRALVRQLIHVAHFADERPVIITIIDGAPGARAAFEALLGEIPHRVDVADLHFIAAEPLPMRTDLWKRVTVRGQVATVYVAELQEGLRSVALARELQKQLPRGTGASVVTCVESLDTAAATLALLDGVGPGHGSAAATLLCLPCLSSPSRRCRIFGVAEHALNCRAALDTSHEIMAEILHHTYVDKGWGSETWEQLDYSARDLNIIASDHFMVRKAMIQAAAADPTILDDIPRIQALLDDPRTLLLEASPRFRPASSPGPWSRQPSPCRNWPRSSTGDGPR